MKATLVVVTDIQDPATQSLVSSVLRSAGHCVIESEGSAQTDLLLANGVAPDLFLMDRAGGVQLENSLSLLIDRVPAEKICLVVGLGDNAAVQSAAGLGIKHFLQQPVTRCSIDALIEQLRPAMVVGPIAEATAPSEQRDADQAPLYDLPSPYLEELHDGGFFLATSPKMLEICRQVKLVADADVNVLVLGESGTGKELIANMIHKHSRRAEGKFVKINCAALPADLLESELFGHRQGAFTGAIRDRAGKFDLADGGTLLLDEIGEMGVQMQAKLLHVLQDGQFTRLGGQEATRVDVRVIAATNIKMESALLERTFREDLYYRLSVLTIKVPPLRERREEIPHLIEEYIRRVPQALKGGFRGSFPSGLMDLCLGYEWRGNLRELKNFVTRTIILRDLDAAARELEEKIAASFTDSQESSEIESVQVAGMRSVVRDVKERTEARMIQEALEITGWNRRRAAERLNISYRGLLYKIQQHRLTPPRPNERKDSMRGFQSVRSGTL